MSKILQLPSIDAHALWAATYDRALNPILSLEERYVEPLLPLMTGMDMLDLACGTGRWRARLARCGAASAVGLDVSAEMLQQARKKPGVGSLVQSDAMKMPLRSASMDFAICSFGLSYMPDIEGFATELSRVMRNRGDVVITDFHPSAHARGWKRSFRHNDAVIEVASFPRPVEHIQETFAEAGFELMLYLEPAFGEEERPIFEKSGKGAVFERLLGEPAIAVFVFKSAGKSLTRPFGRSGDSLRIRTEKSTQSEDPVVRIRRLSPDLPKGRVRDPLAKSRLYLVGGHIALDAHTTIAANIEISAGRIRRVVHESPPENATTLDLRDYLLLPGLINSHDHLEFNLFPRLGRGPYPSCADWAHDIYHPKSSPVREHLSVPKAVRLWWGGLKNLLSGVTTVCHHNPWDEVFEREFPVQVVRRYGWAHSIAFGNDVAGAFASTRPGDPFVIHAGEGTDQRSRDEVFELDRMGVLDGRTILVHGVGFSEAGHLLIAQRGGSLIWCPTSNRFVLGTTLKIGSVGDIDRVALGSDSALTAAGGLLEEIRAANEEGASPHAIYRMVTEGAASILRLKEGEGTLQQGAIANIIAIPRTGKTPADAITQLNASRVHMVMVSGRLHLASDEFIDRCPASEVDGLECIELNGVRRRVRAPVGLLINETAAHLGEDIRLAGMRVSA